MAILKPLTFKDKSLIIPLIFGFILVAVVFGIVLVVVESNKQERSNSQITPTPGITSISIDKIIPDEPQTLTAGIPHTFLIYFNKDIPLGRYEFDLSYADITQDSPQRIPVQKTISLFAPNVVSIKTLSPINEKSEYYLTVIDTQSNTTISSSSYLSGNIEPTPLPSNNQTLKQFLPHETDTYLLEYSGTKNLYIFHFKYDPTNDDDIDTQLQDAKNEAIQYIQSKNVDINSIVIEYRSS